jgi:vacuolar-type H+-ATPase catalytic subunit A/Vma1
MRILDFNVGERVKIRKSNLTGLIIRIGGTYAVVQLEEDYRTIKVRITNLIHLDSFIVRLIRKMKRKLR